MKDSFVYCWFDKGKYKKYIGVHKGNLDDGYICSSSDVLTEYNSRPFDFDREILAVGSFKEMALTESQLLQMIDARNNPGFYNKHNVDGLFRTQGPLSDSHKEKISRSMRGNVITAETKEKIRSSMTGFKRGPLTDDQRLRLSKIRKGRKLSEEHRKKISANHKGGTPKGFVFGPRSAETRQRISASLLGHEVTEETRSKIRAKLTRAKS